MGRRLRKVLPVFPFVRKPLLLNELESARSRRLPQIAPLGYYGQRTPRRNLTPLVNLNNLLLVIFYYYPFRISSKQTEELFEELFADKIPFNVPLVAISLFPTSLFSNALLHKNLWRRSVLVLFFIGELLPLNEAADMSGLLVRRFTFFMCHFCLYVTSVL